MTNKFTTEDIRIRQRLNDDLMKENEQLKQVIEGIKGHIRSQVRQKMLTIPADLIELVEEYERIVKK